MTRMKSLYDSFKPDKECTVDGCKCDFWHGFMKQKDMHYWITTSTCHLSSKGFPTHLYGCSKSAVPSIKIERVKDRKL